MRTEKSNRVIFSEIHNLIILGIAYSVEVRLMPIERCYRTGVSKPLQAAGYAALALGAVLLFVCVPCWAWLALLGLALLAAGFLLLKLSNTGR